MHDLPDAPRERPVLTSRQTRQVQNASRVLAAARISDLARLDAAGSILMIESLRSALDDTLRIIGETCD